MRLRIWLSRCDVKGLSASGRTKYRACRITLPGRSVPAIISNGSSPAEAATRRLAHHARAASDTRRPRAFHMAGFCEVATLNRIQVDGSWLGEKRLPGAAT